MEAEWGSGWITRAALCEVLIVGAVMLASGCAATTVRPFEEGERRCGANDGCLPPYGVCACDARCRAVDDGRGRRDPGPTPQTVVYAIPALRIATAGPEDAFGLDLDGAVDGPSGCVAAHDRTSLRTGSRGIDNQAQPLLHEIEDLRGRSIAAASFDTTTEAMRVWALEVSGIDDFVDDCAVDVRLLLLQREGGGNFVADATCRVHGDAVGCEAEVARGCVWSPEDGRCLGVQLEQRATEWAVTGVATGRIAGGVLHTDRVGQMQLELTYPDEGTFAAQLYETRVDAEITPLSLSGELGGAFEADNLSNLYRSLAIGRGPTPTFEELRARVAPDLAPDESGSCANVSAGFAFSGVPFVVVP